MSRKAALLMSWGSGAQIPTRQNRTPEQRERVRELASSLEKDSKNARDQLWMKEVVIFHLSKVIITKIFKHSLNTVLNFQNIVKNKFIIGALIFAFFQMCRVNSMLILIARGPAHLPQCRPTMHMIVTHYAQSKFCNY